MIPGKHLAAIAFAVAMGLLSVLLAWLLFGGFMQWLGELGPAGRRQAQLVLALVAPLALAGGLYWRRRLRRRAAQQRAQRE